MYPAPIATDDRVMHFVGRNKRDTIELTTTVALKRAVHCYRYATRTSLREHEHSVASSLQSVEHSLERDCVTLVMSSVCYSVMDHALQEYLKNLTCVCVGKSRDTLYACTAGQTPNGSVGHMFDAVQTYSATTTTATMMFDVCVSKSLGTYGHDVRNSKTRKCPVEVHKYKYHSPTTRSSEFHRVLCSICDLIGALLPDDKNLAKSTFHWSDCVDVCCVGRHCIPVC